jgi:hypothetical protein
MAGLSRGNSSWANTSRFASNHGQSNFGRSFGNSRLGGSNFSNASFSRFGSRRFDRFGRFDGGFNRFDRFGFGFGGYGRGGFGDPFDFWFLGDLFGLALNLGELSLGWPAWGFVGVNLLDAGVQALSNSSGDNGNYGYDNSGYGYQQQAYTPLCGNYYSDENPGCIQQF